MSGLGKTLRFVGCFTLIAVVVCAPPTSTTTAGKILPTLSSSLGSCGNDWTKHDISPTLHLCLKSGTQEQVEMDLWIKELVIEHLKLKQDFINLKGEVLKCQDGRNAVQDELNKCRNDLDEAHKPKLFCPSGWEQYENKCFKLLSNDLKNYDQAKKGCTTLDNQATLVTINSPVEQQFMEELIFRRWKLSVGGRKQNWATGMWLDSVRSANGEFSHWTDGTRIVYTNWAPGQPDLPGRELHLQLVMATEDSLGLWNNNLGTSLQFAVCQIKAESRSCIVPQ